jgi:hypothetical protein
MVLARQVAEGLGLAEFDEFPGAYLLGSTTPDIRVITRGDRRDTHFFDLAQHDHQDSVAAFLDAYSQLTDPGTLSPETRAFVAGYLTHLVLDEQYITGIYRRFFLRHEDLGGIVRANVMDRLLQFDLDRAYGDDPEVVSRLLEALAFTVESIECGFVDHETLERWRQVTVDVAAREMDWDRARQMISRHLERSGLPPGRELQEFLDSLPDLEGETIALVTDAEIEGFIQRSTEAAARTVARYFECG